MDSELPPPPTRQTRAHRRHRIVAVKLGDAWVGTVHARDGAIVGSVEASSSQEVMVRGVGVVNELLSAQGSASA